MNELELAWAAGFLDGEGTFQIAFDSNYNHKIMISAENTHQNSIGRLNRILGGSTLPLKARNPNARITYRWYVSSKTAEEVARILLPFLFTKKEQARLLITLRETGLHNRSGISEEIYKVREDIRSQLIVLNKRGI